MTTSEFIQQHRCSDPRQAAFLASRYPGVDMPYALDQIKGWQTARHKLPTWAAAEGIVYPHSLNMEQCSSEPAARYKAEVAQRWIQRLAAGGGAAATSMADLTGGFGVDFSFTARCFGSATYVERDAELCRIAAANLPHLGISHADTVCADAASYLAGATRHTMIFIDPARRDTHGAKTVLIADCTPDVCAMLPTLMDKAQFVMLKLSPMLDWHKAAADLGGTVRETHIVSVGGECKELLLVLCAQGDGSGMRVICTDIQPKPGDDGTYARSEFAYTAGDACAPTPLLQGAPQAGCWLHEPNASVMKAGCFAQLAEAYGMRAVSANSHLLVASRMAGAFPGRAFAIDAVTTLNKRQLHTALAGIERANIATRNFPMTVAELRKRLRLKDGGDRYIFATTTAGGEHVLLLCHKPQDNGGGAPGVCDFSPK